MATIRIPTPLRKLTQGKEEVIAAGGTIGALITALETQYPGKMPVETDEGEGRPSRWNTLRALRVLNWYSQGAA